MSQLFRSRLLAGVRLHALALLAPLSLALSAWAGPSAVIDAPANPDALQEVRSLLDYLNSIKGSQIIAGQDCGLNWDGTNTMAEVGYLYQQTGHKPAIRGLDFIFLNDPNDVDWNTKQPLQQIARDAIDWWKGGGLVALQWHWKLGSTNHFDFYVTKSDGSQACDWDIERGLTPGTAENTKFNADIDQVAAELKKLRDARIPVLWRPFHEVGGNWFWWSAHFDTATRKPVLHPELFKRLWIHLFKRLTYVHGLTNLAWVWNPTFSDKATLDKWYPGDQYVDIVSYDVYPATGTHPDYAADYKNLNAYRGGRKVVAMSENGPIPDIDSCFANGAEWSYFSTWNGSFITDATKAGVAADSTAVSNNLNVLKNVYNHARVLTLDELPRTDALNRKRVAPGIVTAPAAAKPAPGARCSLSVLATGDTPLSYQWTRNGVAVPGATADTLTFPAVSVSDAGNYAVTITNAAGSATSTPVALDPTGTAAKPASVLCNVSARAMVGTGFNVLIAGFNLSGEGAKTLLLRAVGPTLGELGLPNTLAFPSITLYEGTTELVHNTNWTTNVNAAEIKTAMANAGAFAISETGGDSVLLVTLPAGHGFTAIAKGADGGSGVALLEIYDLDQASTAHLSNLSARGQIGANNNGTREPLVAGFIIAGSAGKQMLIRAAGPTLAAKPFEIAEAINGVRLNLMDKKQQLVTSNEAWDLDATPGALIAKAAYALGAFPFSAGSKDAALLRTQPPELFTAIIEPSGTSTGVGIVEVYDADTFKP